MKITKLLFALLALSISTVTFANSGPDYPTVGEEIKTLIQKADIDFEDTEKVMINFLINSDSKLIIVSTSDKENEASLRSVLNLKKVNKGDLEMNTIYSLPIQLKKM